MPRYSRSRSRTPPRRRRRRSYSSSTSSRSRSRSRSRSPVRGSQKYRKKSTRGRSHSRSPPRKDQGRRGGGGYKSSLPKHRGRRSRSYTPEKRRFGSSSKARSRSPKRSPQQGGRDSNHGQNEADKYGQEEGSGPQAGYQEGPGQSQQGMRTMEGPQLPPGHGGFQAGYEKGVLVQDASSYGTAVGQQGNSQSKYGSSQSQAVERSYSKDVYRDNEKMKYEAVSPDALRFETPSRSESPFGRKVSKSKAEPQPQYYQVQEKYTQGQGGTPGQGLKPAGPVDPQNVKVGPPHIIRPIFDPYSVKIPRRKDEGLKEIFDRPELKARFAPQQMQPEAAQEARFAGGVEKKEPVVFRQDVLFTGNLPSGAFPQQAQAFVERREPLILGFDTQRDPFLEPNVQYTQRVGPTGVGQFPGPPSGFNVQLPDQFGVARDAPNFPEFNRQAMFVPQEQPPISGTTQSPISYQYPPDDLPDIKGPHDLRHDLESRRKQNEQQQSRNRSRSKSHSRSRSRQLSHSSRQQHSRSRSRSPMQQYKSSSRQRGRSRSSEPSDDERSVDRRPIRERLGGPPRRSRGSSPDSDSNQDSFKWRKSTFYHQHDRREDRSKSRDRGSRDRDFFSSYKDKTTKFYRGSMRGNFRGNRGRGYLGKNFIPNYNPTFKRGYNNRGMRGRFQPRRGFTSASGRRSPLATWTHDLFDKDKGDADGDKGKKEKKKQKNEKSKDKKSVKQKGKTVKKTKKSKKSPTKSESAQANEGSTQEPPGVTTAS